jgi:hypothetical protein
MYQADVPHDGLFGFHLRVSSCELTSGGGGGGGNTPGVVVRKIHPCPELIGF